MIDNYERIAEIKAELNYLDNHRSYLEQLKKELASLLQRKKELEKQLIKENKDVENLEKTTIISLFQSLIGQKEERLEKERYEAMQTSLAYHKAKNEYDMTLASVQNLENRYAKEESLLKELETLQLKSSLMPLEEKEQFQKLKREFEEKEEIIKEIKEAQNAGYVTSEVLEKVEENLKSAKNWGIYDLVGGDFFGAMMKHSRIDEAQRLLQESIYKLNAFEKELKDVQGFHLDLIIYQHGIILLISYLIIFLQIYLFKIKLIKVFIKFVMLYIKLKQHFNNSIQTYRIYIMKKKTCKNKCKTL